MRSLEMDLKIRKLCLQEMDDEPGSIEVASIRSTSSRDLGWLLVLMKEIALTFV